MINIFNRSVLFMTYDEHNKDTAIQALQKHGIDYVLKTTNVKREYADEDLLGDVKARAYIIYVHDDDMDKALRYVRLAIFKDK